jgi:hypothetical protein
MVETRPAFSRTALIAAIAWLFAATSAWGDVRQTANQFGSYLALGYREVSTIADRNGDAFLARHFLARSRLAGADQPVAPEAPSESSLSAWTAREAALARQQLVARLDGGARRAQPLLAAIAHVNFDC